MTETASTAETSATIQEPQPSPKCEEKLKNVLELILKPEFMIQNDTYFHKLLTHLSKADDKNPNKLLQSQTIISWIPTALTYWETNKLPNNRICSFMLNLTALVSQNETTFVTYSLELNNVYERIFNLFKLQEPGVEPTIKLAYVRILSSFLDHSSGLEWIIANNIWKDCINFCLDNETLYIIKEGHTFIYNLITRTVEHHPEFCALVVGEIFSKLVAEPNENNTVLSQFVGSRLKDKCAPALHLLTFILSQLLENEHKNGDYRAAHLLLANNTLEEKIKQLKPCTNDVEDVYDLYAVLIHIKILNVLMKKNEATYENYYSAGVELMGFISELFCVKYIPVVIRLTHLTDSLWNHMPDVTQVLPASTNAEGNRREPLRFQNQLLVFEITPIFGICFLYTNFCYDGSDDVREDFITSFFRMLHEKTIRMGYTWREVLFQQTEGFQMAKLGALRVLRAINNYNKSRAIMIFQVLIYTLKDIQLGLSDKPALIDIFVQHDSFMITLFETMAAVINKYEISWRDSVETICVMHTAIEYINQAFWPPRVIVHALKLVDLSIAKFLPPDLALLIEDDSSTNILGSTLTAKLYDRHWEIRDSTLEILHTIAKISNSKYPLFQTMLLNVDIIPMIVTMTQNDSSGFVRAAAIKCLQEMIQVHEIWTKILVNQQLAQKMIHILNYESEAIVRTEAAKLMANIHEYQFFPNDLMKEIYESMALAAAKDLHWEVKSNALDFWGKVVLNHLQEQGWIDHKFPSVTFSREQRKIVTLTVDEVQRRLKKVLSQLSEIGCLGVLVYAIQEDCDLEVSKKSLSKLKKMKHSLQLYNMFECYEKVAMPGSNNNETAATVVASKIDFSDATLDRILDCNDSTLLNDLCTQENPTPLYSEQTKQMSMELLKVTPEVFMTFLQNDLDSSINEKTQWLNKLDDLESLLDDMGKTYDCNVNTMDCY